MRLFTILILAFIFIGVGSSVAGTYYFYIQSNELLEKNAVDHLESVAKSTENLINFILEKQGEKLKIAATHSYLSIEELQEIVGLQEEFYNVFVLDSDGIITSSSDEFQIGENKSMDECFINGKHGLYFKPIYLSNTMDANSIAISAPYNGGVIVAMVGLDIFDEIVSDRTGLGETGEVLLAYDKSGEVIFFTERRFGEKNGVEEVALPMKEALSANEDLFFNFLDYRHVPVIAITKYIESVEVGLVVKIDEDEALGAARRQLISTSMVLIAISAFFVFIVSFFIARLVSKPIIILTREVEEVTHGKLDIQLTKTSITEVKHLADSLSRILASLKLAILKTGGCPNPASHASKKVLAGKSAVESLSSKTSAKKVGKIDKNIRDKFLKKQGDGL